MKRLWIIVAAIFAVVGLGRPALADSFVVQFDDLTDMVVLNEFDNGQLFSTFRFPSESGGAIDVINNPRLF